MNRLVSPVPETSWARELGFDVATLELERPTDWFQAHMADLQTKRAAAYSDFIRYRDSNRAFASEVVAWERYTNLTRIVCDLTGAAIPVDIIAREQVRRRNVEEQVLNNTCNRCGFVWSLRQPRFVKGLCSSCLALQEKVLRRGRLACQPWQGRFASDDVTPVNAAGLPVLPGERYCKHSDCVNPKHIKKGNMNHV